MQKKLAVKKHFNMIFYTNYVINKIFLRNAYNLQMNKKNLEKIKKLLANSKMKFINKY